MARKETHTYQVNLKLLRAEVKAVQHVLNLETKIMAFMPSFTFLSMLSGSLVTTAWHVLRLQMEGMASRCGE
jgi:hypothetical protein